MEKFDIYTAIFVMMVCCAALMLFVTLFSIAEGRTLVAVMCGIAASCFAAVAAGFSNACSDDYEVDE